MQLTASKPDVHAWSVCRRERMLRGMHRGSRQLILCLVRPLPSCFYAASVAYLTDSLLMLIFVRPLATDVHCIGVL